MNNLTTEHCEEILLNDVRFSCSMISNVVNKKCWQWDDNSYNTIRHLIRVVRMPDGKLITFDNKRVMSAKRANKDKLRALVIPSTLPCRIDRYVVWECCNGGSCLLLKIQPITYGALIRLKCAESNDNLGKSDPLILVTATTTTSQKYIAAQTESIRYHTTKPSKPRKLFSCLRREPHNVYISNTEYGIFVPVYNFHQFVNDVRVFEIYSLTPNSLKSADSSTHFICENAKEANQSVNDAEQLTWIDNYYDTTINNNK